MTKLTAKNHADIEQVTALRKAHASLGATVRAEVEAQVAARLAASHTSLVTAMAAAHAGGVPVTVLGRAYGSSDFRTIKNLISQGQVYLSDAPDTENPAQGDPPAVVQVAQTGEGWALTWNDGEVTRTTKDHRPLGPKDSAGRTRWTPALAELCKN